MFRRLFRNHHCQYFIAAPFFIGLLIMCFILGNFKQLTADVVNIQLLYEVSWKEYFNSHSIVVCLVIASSYKKSVDMKTLYEASIVPDVYRLVHEISWSAQSPLHGGNVFAEFEATDAEALVNKWNLKSFPVFVIATNKGNSIVTYDGQHTGPAINQWIFSSFTPPLKLLKSRSSIELFRELLPLTFEIRLDSDGSSSNQNSNKKFFVSLVSDLVSQMSKIGVFVQSPPDAEQQQQEKKEESTNEIIVHRANEPTPIVIPLTPSTSVAHLKSRILFESVPLFPSINIDNYHNYINESSGTINRSTLWCVGDSNDYSSLSPAMQVVSEAFRNTEEQEIEVPVVWVDVDDYEEHIKTFFHVSTYPAILLQLKSSNQMFEFTEYPILQQLESDSSLLSSSIIKFVKDGLSGSLLQSVKQRSEPEPAEDQIAASVAAQTSRGRIPIVTISAVNLEANIFDEVNDVLLAVTIPDHQQTVVLEQALRKFALNNFSSYTCKELKIFKIDAKENDIHSRQGFELANLPSLLYIKAKSEIPIRFLGPSTDKAIELFVQRVKLNQLFPPGFIAAATRAGKGKQKRK